MILHGEPAAHLPPVAVDRHGEAGDGVAHEERHQLLLDLPGGSLVVTTLQIRNSQEITLPNGKIIRRLGCLFVDMPKSMMGAVQRYITRLEREQNAKSTGFN